MWPFDVVPPTRPTRQKDVRKLQAKAVSVPTSSATYSFGSDQHLCDRQGPGCDMILAAHPEWKINSFLDCEDSIDWLEDSSEQIRKAHVHLRTESILIFITIRQIMSNPIVDWPRIVVRNRHVHCKHLFLFFKCDKEVTLYKMLQTSFATSCTFEFCYQAKARNRP